MCKAQKTWRQSLVEAFTFLRKKMNSLPISCLAIFSEFQLLKTGFHFKLPNSSSGI